MNNPYDLQPEQYNFDNLELHWVFDQFLYLRDTLIFSWKKYTGKAWCKLVVWDKEKTIEILWNNIFQQSFETITDWDRTDLSIGPYVSWNYDIASDAPINTPLCCEIQKNGRYKLTHKEEILLDSTTNKVFCYIDVYRLDDYWSIIINDKLYRLAYPWGIAVFDWEGNTSLSWTTSWTEPDGSCTVSISLWKLFKKMTASWYIEMDLLKGDVLVLRAKDASNPDGSPAWNDLTLQTNSNYWSIEYLNLPYNS